MEISLEQQSLCLLASFLMGLILGLIYELFTFFRLLSKKKFLWFLWDFFYMLVFSLFCIIFSIAYSEGRVRYFTVLGTVCGILLVRFTLGRVLTPMFRKIAELCGKIIKIVTEIESKFAKKVLQVITKILYNKNRKKKG